VSSLVDLSLLSIDMLNDAATLASIIFYALQQSHQTALDDALSKIANQHGQDCQSTWSIQDANRDRMG
jgi:hypothetical protein